MHYLTGHSAPVVSLFGEKPWPRHGWSIRPVRLADLIAVANDLTSDMPVDLFGAHDERHPSTVYEYDDDLFTSMATLSAMRAEMPRGGNMASAKITSASQIDIAACKSPAANAASPARSRSIASSDT